MKIYEEKNKKREIQCNYCLHFGHNKRNCPTMKAHWDANPQVHENYDHDSLTDIDKSMWSSHYQSYWGDDQAIRQFRAHWQYMKKRFAEKPKTTKKRRKPKCGFCGSTTHTRRNCSKMKNLIYVLQETNKAYRSHFYDHFVDGLGYGAGALVQFNARSWNSKENETKVGIIEKFPIEQIMFTNLTSRWSDYHTSLQVTILVDGQRHKTCGDGIMFLEDSHSDHATHGKMNGLYSCYSPVSNIMSPAPQKPSKEWFLGQAPCFDFVVKKRNAKQIMNGLYEVIKKFYPHDNLRSKLGAKIYDQFYTR